jgi:hypothetical protein
LEKFLPVAKGEVFNKSVEKRAENSGIYPLKPFIYAAFLHFASLCVQQGKWRKIRRQ